MKKMILIIVGLLLIIAGVLAYAFRPTPLPTPIAEETPKVETNNSSEHKILAEKSKATFEIKEVLRGNPFLVVGETNNVSGTISFSDGGTPTVSEIKINARTLKTDAEGRNRALNRFILKTDDSANEFIVFSPKNIEGLPADPKPLEKYSFIVKGDLTIAGVTKEVAFNTEAQMLADKTITGNAKTTIKYKDFGLKIPQVDFVASVEENVVLSFDFGTN